MQVRLTYISSNCAVLTSHLNPKLSNSLQSNKPNRNLSKFNFCQFSTIFINPNGPKYSLDHSNQNPNLNSYINWFAFPIFGKIYIYRLFSTPPFFCRFPANSSLSFISLIDSKLDTLIDSKLVSSFSLNFSSVYLDLRFVHSNPDSWFLKFC